MKENLKKTVKFAAGVCAALGVVTLGAVVASGTAVRVVAEGFKAGAAAMKKTMTELQAEQNEPAAAEEASASAAEEAAAEDFEN